MSGAGPTQGADAHPSDGGDATRGGATTERTRLRRMPERGATGRAALEAVLDAGFVCHIGLVVDGWPTVLPTSYGRSGSLLYLHGSVASRSLRVARDGVPVCVTITHVDGLVLARSVFEHSVNYRCAVVFGRAVLLEGDEKIEGLRVLTEHVAPGQWNYARRPNERELAQTTVLRLGLDEASVKIRTGPPEDGDSPDAALGIWAGELPLRTAALAHVPAPEVGDALGVPPHLARLADRLDTTARRTGAT